MARRAPDREFLAEISHQLREGLRKRDDAARAVGGRYTRVEAAKELCVSRATLQFYLAGTHMPSTDILRRAMELWGIELTYRGRILTIRDLESPHLRPRAKQQPAKQLSLWDSIKRLEDGALSVQIERKGPKSITLRVEIGFVAERAEKIG